MYNYWTRFLSQCIFRIYNIYLLRSTHILLDSCRFRRYRDTDRVLYSYFVLLFFYFISFLGLEMQGECLLSMCNIYIYGDITYWIRQPIYNYALRAVPRPLLLLANLVSFTLFTFRSFSAIFFTIFIACKLFKKFN